MIRRPPRSTRTDPPFPSTTLCRSLYGRAADDSKFSPDFLIPPLTISASNPFLSTTIRDQLVAAGETSFTMGRVFNDVYEMSFDSVREDKEFAVGIDGEVGPGFRYNAYYTHGEVANALRSEEHTFELQSLMRISYAVFCLKKK